MDSKSKTKCKNKTWISEILHIKIHQDIWKISPISDPEVLWSAWLPIHPTAWCLVALLRALEFACPSVRKPEKKLGFSEFGVFFLKTIFDPYRLIYWKFLTLQMVCWFPWLANFHQKVKNWMGKALPPFLLNMFPKGLLIGTSEFVFFFFKLWLNHISW